MMLADSKKPWSGAGKHRYKSWFGLDPFQTSVVWRELVASGWTSKAGKKGQGQPKHLLWALSFLRSYNPESVQAPRMGADEKTYRKWVWFYVEGMASLDNKWVGSGK